MVDDCVLPVSDVGKCLGYWRGGGCVEKRYWHFPRLP
jgi:hypothetical protein